MFHFLAAAVLASGPNSVMDLSANSPLVLGPIAAFIFTIFITEVVVPGKAYKREVEENKRLRDLTEKVVPLAEQMVAASKDMVEVTKEASRSIDSFLDFIDYEGQRRRKDR